MSCSVFVKPTPAAAPPAGSGYENDVTDSSSAFTFAGVERSGFLSPVLTATPTATRASGVSEFAITFPDATTSGYGGWTIGTSNGTPSVTCFFVPRPEPNVGFTL